MRILRLLLLISVALLWQGLTSLSAMAVSQDAKRLGCDFCLREVNNLDQPLSLVGAWLFTREDSINNKNIEIDTSTWRTIKAPGSWRNVYADGTNFTVGWYRGVFQFAPELVGQKVVLLANAYMGRVTVYVDGQEVYRRPNNMNVERYYSIQAIPVRFTITQPRQVVTIRVETPLMKGIYQLPFELRAYEQHDKILAFYQLWGGEVRLIASYTIFFFGLFFLLVYWKTKFDLYLVAALGSVFVFPFFGAPGDSMLMFFEPEQLLYVHYMGLCTTYFAFLFCQFFYKFTPRTNWILGAVHFVLACVIGMMAVFPNVDLFQQLRPIYFLVNLYLGLGAGYAATRALINREPGSRVLFVGVMCFIVAAVHDMGLALDLYNSFTMIFTGVLLFTVSMLFVAISRFANTFRDNKRLVGELQELNDSLEHQVIERTQELAAANQELRTAFEQLSLAKNEVVRSEKMAALGAMVAGIAHELNTPIGNGLMMATHLVKASKRMIESVKTGLRKSTLDDYIAENDVAGDVLVRNLTKAAELVSSFKQVAVDRTSSQRRNFKLDEVVYEVISMLKPTIQATSYAVEFDVPDSISMSSFPGPLGQVLTNLINNAFVHGFEGLDSGQVYIEAMLWKERGVVVMRVSDNGNGMTADVQAKIFDPFFTTKLGTGGSGLGLHIVHNLITEILSGVITVESTPGKGTCFTLELPQNVAEHASH